MPLVPDYIPTYIKQQINASPKQVITAERWNELFNLVITQGDNTTDDVVSLLTALAATTAAANIGADVPSVVTKTVQGVLTAFEAALADRYTKNESNALVTTNTNDLVKSITFNDMNGTFTITKKDGAVVVIDTLLEKVPVSMVFETVGNVTRIKLTNQDGSTSSADVSALVDNYTFGVTDTIALSTTGAGNQKTVNATLRDGSVTLPKLDLESVTQLEGYRDAAANSATAALNSQNAASASKDAAATSASAASSSKDAAASSATDALASKNAAATSASEALTSKNAAASSASDALASKNAAATSASGASASATTATTKATEATTGASTATAKASEAVTSAAAAATSATNAANSATAASGSATAAANSASASATSASNATTSEANSLTNKNASAASATAAAASAVAADASADAAAASASEAAAIVGQKVATFNGREGVVVPQAGDYTAAMVGAVTRLVDGNANGAVRSTAADPTAQMGVNAIATGEGTAATGAASHAEGRYTTANADHSHAEGQLTTASGVASHSEGIRTTASALASHAEGFMSNASGEFSHAEGFITTASGVRSHAEGGGTTASGDCSHAEGADTVASGDYSHSQNQGTKAQGKSQTVLGEFNVSQGTVASRTAADHALIVGNGTADNARSNAMSLTWEGTLEVAKDVKVGSVSLTGHVADSTKHVGTATKTTPVDADSVALVDSVDGSKVKKLTWANLKTALTSVLVPNTRTVNSKPLSSDITLTASDVGAATAADVQTVEASSLIRDLNIMLNQSLGTANIDAWADLLADASRINAGASSWYVLSGGLISKPQSPITEISQMATSNTFYGFGRYVAGFAFAIGQTFKTTKAYQVDTIKVKFKRLNSKTDYVRLKIYATNGTTPTTLLYTSTTSYLISNISTTSTEYSFSFSGANLEANKTYAFFIERTDTTSSTDDLSAEIHSTSQYSDGSIFTNQVGSYYQQTGDLYFVITSTTPTSATVIWNAVTATEALIKVAVAAEMTLGAGTITFYVSHNGTTWTQITALNAAQAVSFTGTSVYLKAVITKDAALSSVAWGGY